jgi:hypothetical protein
VGQRAEMVWAEEEGWKINAGGGGGIGVAELGWGVWGGFDGMKGGIWCEREG